jgi:hypothetical protein
VHCLNLLLAWGTFTRAKELWNRYSKSIQKYRSYIIISIILIVIAIFSIGIWSSLSSSSCKSNPTNIFVPHDNAISPKHLLLKIHIGRLKYSPGQIIDLSGSVFDSATRKNVSSTLIMVVNQTAGQLLPWCYSDLPKQRVTQFASIPTDNNGNFTYSNFGNQNIGRYNIIIYPIDSSQSRYSIPIEVVNPFFTLTAYFLYTATIFFILLMITNLVPSKKEKELRKEQQQNDQEEGSKKKAKNNEEQEDRVEDGSVYYNQCNPMFGLFNELLIAVYNYSKLQLTELI